MKEPSVTIRRAVLDDATAIAEVHVASYLLDSAQHKGVGRRLVREWAGLALAADGGVVGFISGGAIREALTGFDAYPKCFATGPRSAWRLASQRTRAVEDLDMLVRVPKLRRESPSLKRRWRERSIVK